MTPSRNPHLLLQKVFQDPISVDWREFRAHNFVSVLPNPEVKENEADQCLNDCHFY